MTARIYIVTVSFMPSKISPLTRERSADSVLCRAAILVYCATAIVFFVPKNHGQISLGATALLHAKRLHANQSSRPFSFCLASANSRSIGSIPCTWGVVSFAVTSDCSQMVIGNVDRASPQRPYTIIMSTADTNVSHKARHSIEDRGAMAARASAFPSPG